MLYKSTPKETTEISLHSSSPENLSHPYEYGVVIPYSSNLRENDGMARGKERLSFYSSFALNAALEMYNDRRFHKFVLFSDATFGEKRKSTGMLMKEALLRSHTTQHIEESDIVLFDAIHLNNTPAQIKELAEYLLNNNLETEQFLFIDWRFHDERVRRYMQGFGIVSYTVSVEDSHKYYNPRFQFEKLQQILPKDFEERERKLRLLAHFDRRGFIPRLLKMLTGPIVTDIRKIRYSNAFSSDRGKVHLVFENLSGKDKLCQMVEKNNDKGTH